jgi:NADPH:quinone reductase-like Zn-dependent oxidoreductase
MHAVSFKYRGFAILHGKHISTAIERGIPASEVIAIGSEPKDFTVGDRVLPIYDQNNLTGTGQQQGALGGGVEGVIRQYAIFDQKVLVLLAETSYSRMDGCMVGWLDGSS